MMLPILLLVWLENNFFYVVIVGIGLSLINETINLSKKQRLKNLCKKFRLKQPVKDKSILLDLIILN